MENKEDRYTELDPEIAQDFMNIVGEKAIPIPVGFAFLNDNKAKNMVKVSKMSGKYQFLTNKEVCVEFNEEMYYKFDDVSRRILIEQEIDKIGVNMDNGNIKMEKPDLVTFSPLVEKYGIEQVSRANGVENLTVSQKNDQREQESYQH